MEARMDSMFSNKDILNWLTYYAENTDLDLEKVKILDITGKNKNLIPTVITNETVLVLTDAGHPEIFYSMWDAGLGECEIWYNEGSDPSGQIKHDRLADMINRGINASAGMVICNPSFTSTYQVGLHNENFSAGSIHYVCQEIRAIIINKLQISAQDVLCIISGESIAVEAAMLATQGDVLAVEYNRNDREAMESNVEKFGLNNVHILDNMELSTLDQFAKPTIGFIVASERLENEIANLKALNPNIRLVIYTLELGTLSKIPSLFEKYNIKEQEIVQVSVSKLDGKDTFAAEPSPWIISGQA